jgi:hypothetical protein
VKNGLKAVPLGFINMGVLAAATGCIQTLSAFDYTNSNLLLVFRKDNALDVEFNIGSVTNFLGKANGTTMQVTNWSLPGVRTDTLARSIDQD